MWAFIFLSILGLNICQATKEDNSTQMYYVKLTIEENAIANITEILKPFVSNTALKVDDLKMTTVCQSVPGGTECSCKSDFRWSDKVCQSNQKCCDAEKCTFTGNLAHMCVSSKTVSIKGSIRLYGEEHHTCLKDKNTDEFKQCNNKLLEKMKKVYSTLRGFDILTICKYKVGSVIADFELTIADKVNPQDLIEKSNRLNISVSASLDMETTGVVHLIMPPNPVCYYNQPKLRCKLQEDLETKPVWQLKRQGEVFEIFSGTESNVTSTTLETNVTLKNISQRWEGEYSCVYKQKSDSCTISHKASAVMDISLLPNIDITTEPAFPHCSKGSGLVHVRVKCEIEKSNEHYNVLWTSQNINLRIQSSGPEESEKTAVYTAETAVECNEPTRTPQLTCTFHNRCNETRKATTVINIIYESDQFCTAEGDWADTKAGFTAVIKCTNAAGQRQRKCRKGSTEGIWEEEESACVNQKVDSVLQKANVVDTGLGSLNENAAGVFSLLENITNNSQTINTFANMNASVQVLLSLSQRLKNINNESTTDDFLESSSNMLEKSLDESWTARAEEGNASLAQKYLISVEQLIQMTNITNAPKKKNIEVAASSCTQSSQCGNKVFNVSVVLNGPDPGSVKTAGFKELENYLPHRDEEYKPNSIVVSTTIERKQLDSLEVKINFPLLKARPRNINMQCVSWDKNKGVWSPEGCKWEGPYNEGNCICRHLSSFAILMSRYPVKIPLINEVTYAALSISVISLIISLAIELTVWSTVVKTNTLYLRHTAHINISLCLLVADCCFLASSKPSHISEMWCKILVVLKHFFYLSMFFWMLCLSSMLLHQAIFLFHNVSKKVYLRFSLVLGYMCPLLIVVVTFLTYKGGAEGEYFSHETCWLLHTGLMKGSIYTFVIPVGVIVFFNVFSMLVVIIKLLNHPMNTEKSNENDKKAAKTVIRSVILLTPIFGVTWFFGFVVMLLDLTAGTIAFVVNYLFTVLNGFQGLFILLTTCLGDKLTREALLNRLKKNVPASTTDSTTKLDSVGKT